MDPSRLNIEGDKDLIIPRALYFSSHSSFAEDIRRLEIFYTPEEILKELRQTKELIGNEICVLVSERYGVPTFYRFCLSQTGK